MKKAEAIVQLLYYTEENDLVVNCPQLGIIGVSEDLPEIKNLSKEVVLSVFEGKLNQRISRFKSKTEFIENLFLNEYWEIIGDDFKIKPLDYFIEKYSYLENTLAIENIKIIKYKFEYSTETIEQLENLFKEVNRMIREE
ncbi:hypothetical protein SAMN04488007_0722 [Maribacter aquivivus]|uniref:Uncharacterized protein n=1 Tax=Maribacter aquivivus TaxID=228958 RepID=A0A1M6KB55_9FLAO|nr:hypothetical protein [Maribacter aquivivus]SHJ56163.1 hypothetical protein SAMN04488007_0722 [Maribacter aquivivus]